MKAGTTGIPHAEGSEECVYGTDLPPQCVRGLCRYDVHGLCRYDIHGLCRYDVHGLCLYDIHGLCRYGASGLSRFDHSCIKCIDVLDSPELGLQHCIYTRV